jgi:hypothetical protein
MVGGHFNGRLGFQISDAFHELFKAARYIRRDSSSDLKQLPKYAIVKPCNLGNLHALQGKRYAVHFGCVSVIEKREHIWVSGS